jgi:hypothetical protein
MSQLCLNNLYRKPLKLTLALLLTDVINIFAKAVPKQLKCAKHKHAAQ